MSAELAVAYASKLLRIPEAAEKFGFGLKTFSRFRRRHGIRTMAGNRVHVEDVIAALESERRGR